MRKAITFRPSSIGDALMGKYFLENIRVQYPDARLAIVVGSRASMLRDLFAAEPWLEVVEANRRAPLSLVNLMRRWRGSAIALTYYTSDTLNLPTKLIARLLAARGILVGFSDKSALTRFLYNRLLPLPIRDRSVRLHEKDALAACSIPVRIEKLSLRYVPMPSVAQRFGISGNYVIVHLFSGSKARGLSPESMCALLTALHKDMPNATLVLSGGANDAADAHAAAAGLPAVIIAGRASLQELMNLMADSSGIVSLDTGVAHIAAHIGRPPIVLSTCLGCISWWGEDQYGRGIPAKLFSGHTHPTRLHRFEQYPDCLNAIDMREVARCAKELFI